MLERALEIAKELISIPGCTELPEKESNVARRLCALLQADGLQTELTEAAPNRLNLICVCKGTGGGKKLLLSTHLDTVPAYDMPEPFSPRVRDGRLYGRGAVDVKDILGAMAAVMLTLASSKTRLKGDVVFLAVADEESGSIGMRHAVRDPRVASADFAVIGEPTGLSIGVAHKGVEWFEAVFHGKATHGGSPEKGVNAVYHAACFVEKLTREFIPRLDARVDPLLGRATMNVGYFQGGTRPTIVPDACTIRWDRRILPSETYADVCGEFAACLREMKAEEPLLQYDFRTILGDESRQFPPLGTSPDDPAVVCVQKAGKEILGYAPPLVGLPFWTDAATFPLVCGKPAVVIGPGNIAQAHSNSEYVEVAELERAVGLYHRLALDYCGEVAE